MAPPKSVLITDLDNTLFDWVGLWHKCFSAMLDEVVSISGVSRERLQPEIAAVHQRHGTSEYAFLIEELPSLAPALRGRPAAEVFAPAIEAFRRQRREHLRLYPTVAETLLAIKGRGARVVVYTDSMSLYSSYRLRRLGLDGVVDFAFSPQDHAPPAGLTAEEARKYPARHDEFRYTRHRFTPEGSRKPDPAVLDAIVDGLGVDKSRCVYVGDSLVRDVAMALDAGVDAVWAEYGLAHEREEYELLRAVTHWTAADVERERRLKREHIEPPYVLSSRFGEILEAFDFTDHL